jgi:hypothetical protein
MRIMIDTNVLFQAGEPVLVGVEISMNTLIGGVGNVLPGEVKEFL